MRMMVVDGLSADYGQDRWLRSLVSLRMTVNRCDTEEDSSEQERQRRGVTARKRVNAIG
jgi:hypothetical protein